jgi:peptidoglycan/LPS O-acetylase OafA/YrhL
MWSRVKVWSAISADIVCVLTFAIVGRGSHRQANDLVGVLSTAWPFLAGSLTGYVVARAWRQPASLRSGVVIWLCTVVVGILLRLASGRGAAPTFVLVGAIALGILLLGWRAVLGAVHTARRSAAKHPAS